MKMLELWYGPGECLLACRGYWRGDFYFKLSEEAQQAVVADMRADWPRYREEVLEAWDNRNEHELYLWREYHSEQLRPWAADHFDDGDDA
jgi:hypothetical protein